MFQWEVRRCVFLFYENRACCYLVHFFFVNFHYCPFWCYQMIFNPLKTNQRDKCCLVRAWETFSTTTLNFFLSITTKQFYSTRKVMKMFKHLFTILHRWDTFRCTNQGWNWTFISLQLQFAVLYETNNIKGEWKKHQAKWSKRWSIDSVNETPSESKCNENMCN